MNLVLNVFVNVERKEQDKLAAGSWQGWQANEKEKGRSEKVINNFTRVERNEGILDVLIWARVEPVYQEATWKEHEE